MPFPLNHRTKRDSIGLTAAEVFAAYAVPLLLNMAASGGNPIRTTAPPRLTPFKNERLETSLLDAIGSCSPRVSTRTHRRVVKFYLATGPFTRPAFTLRSEAFRPSPASPRNGRDVTNSNIRSRK